MLALRLPRFPLGQFDAIARQCFVVQVENARRATAVAAVFQFRLYGRGRTRIVNGRIGGCRRGHGENRKAEKLQYKWMPPGLPMATPGTRSVASSRVESSRIPRIVAWSWRSRTSHVHASASAPVQHDAPVVSRPTGTPPSQPRAYFACAPGFTAPAAALSASGCHAAPSEYQSTRRVSVMMPARIANSSSEPSISALSSDSSSP